MRGIPYVLHEKDVRPGLATRMFAGGAAAICTTLPGTEKRLGARRIVVTGVPLRPGFEPRTPAVPPRTLLVTGGRPGAPHPNKTAGGGPDRPARPDRPRLHPAGRAGGPRM